MTDENEFDPELPSKTQLKQEATELQELGERLTTFDAKVLETFPLSDVLLAELAEFNRLPNSHGARRRQLQFIGKLMRDVDFGAVTQAIDALESKNLRKQNKPPLAKRLCEDILESGDTAINTLLEQYPQLERQTLRQLHREYHRAAAAVRDKYKTKLQNHLQQEVGD